MTSFSHKDYLRLLEELTDQQYDDDSYDIISEIPEESWMPEVSSAKEKMLRSLNANKTINITNFKKDQIQDALYQNTNIQVGNFLIKIQRYNGYPDKTNQITNLTMDISVYEKQFKTMSGFPCNMDLDLNIHKDNRFIGRTWLSLFNSYNGARNIPASTVVEIVRWMQALKRMTAFL
jgi:hypothetical protein